MAVHHARQFLTEQRTAQINQIRGALTEFGLVVPTNPDNLRAALHDLIEDASNEMNGLARILLQRGYQHWIAIDEQLRWCDEQIGSHIANDSKARKAQTLYGVGPLTASAMIASVVDFKQFKNGAQFGAWLGLTPKQHSSGGLTNLGSITKHGNTYLRMLLVQGAKSAVQHAPKRTDSLSKWIVQLKDRVGWQKQLSRWLTKTRESCGRSWSKTSTMTQTSKVPNQIHQQPKQPVVMQSVLVLDFCIVVLKTSGAVRMQ